MSKIRVACPHCQKEYRVAAAAAGKTTKCKQCEQRFRITVPSSSDSFGLPDVKDFVSGQDFNPVVNAGAVQDSAEVDSQSPQPSEPGPLQQARVRDWKKEIKKKKNSGPFGPLQRVLLTTGIICGLASVVLNLFNLLGMQLVDGLGTMGCFIGLAIGLLGAGLIGGSLFRFPAAAKLAGAGTAIFVFAVFMGAVVNTQDGDARESVSATGDPKVGTENKLAQFNSPWLEKYPTWMGFEDMESMPSPADRWNRHQLIGTPFSASFLGTPKAGKKRMRVNKKNVDMDTLQSAEKGFTFTLSAFKYPGIRKESKEMLNQTELAIGDIEFGESIKKAGYPGREYRVTDTSKSRHGGIFAVEDMVVHISVEGSSTMVPGVLSREFIGSLLTRPIDLTEKAPPTFELDEKQQAHQKAISENLRDLGVLVSEHIRTGGLMNFPAAYLSISAGKDAGDRKFLFHPGKLPIRGVDLNVVKTKEGNAIASFAPIFGEATNDQSIMARSGYALAGIEVNAGAWVKGVRLVFMEVTPIGFDTSKSYRTDWFGTRPSGVGEVLGSDGRPVYGIWCCRTNICKSIGLIREDN